MLWGLTHRLMGPLRRGLACGLTHSPLAARRSALVVVGLMVAGSIVPLPAFAQAAEALRTFLRDSRSGSAQFTQTVISPDGARRRESAGQFEFVRPGRFRFAYTRPFEQLIVADGQRLWVHDPELNQVVSRRQASALAATPAALLAGQAQVDQAFRLSDEPAREGLDWVRATPKDGNSGFESLLIGFRAGELVALELVDNLGQRTVLRFSQMRLNVNVAPERLRFAVPAGADVIQQ